MMGRGIGGAGAFAGRMAGGRFGAPGALFPMGGVLVFLVWVAVAALLVLVFWRIFSKAGFPGALGLLMLVPVVNLGAMAYLAFAEWPALERPAAREAAAVPPAAGAASGVQAQPAQQQVWSGPASPDAPVPAAPADEPAVGGPPE